MAKKDKKKLSIKKIKKTVKFGKGAVKTVKEVLIPGFIIAVTTAFCWLMEDSGRSKVGKKNT